LLFAAISYAAAIIQDNTRGFTFLEALRLNLTQFYLWGAFSPLIYWLGRRFKIEFRPFRLRNLLVQFVALDVLAATHQTIHLAVLWSLSADVRKRFATLGDYYHAYFGFGFYIDLIIAVLIMVLVHALLYHQSLRASELEQSALKAQLAQAQLKALKMQIHPHFLFNTLHSISSLVLEEPMKANKMIALLGDFLRVTLESRDQQQVTLQEEAEFVRGYLEIEQVRFGDRLQVEFNIDPATLSANIPHLILQPVVENAVQHAVAPHAAPVHISIGAKQQDGFVRLEVTDNGPGLRRESAGREGAGIGLTNVRARLDQTYGTNYSLTISNVADGGLSVVMRIPSA
ncbi:MAG TPA: histidine kinase, partial [Chthoniobacterales bacterium]|nr:histidine kinase [Chthoniobacterales bacterium]